VIHGRATSDDKRTENRGEFPGIDAEGETSEKRGGVECWGGSLTGRGGTGENFS